MHEKSINVKDAYKQICDGFQRKFAEKNFLFSIFTAHFIIFYDKSIFV